MCTVTYIPSRQGCFLTSSRDEHVLRPAATDPKQYEHNENVLMYPKDTKANGTWIALAQNGNAAVLLNGGFVKHICRPPYRKSRGLVVLDIIAHAQPQYFFTEIDLDSIEPFTLILYADKYLYEARWDGEQKHFIQLDETSPYIWSSATLYTPEIINKRKYWFTKWMAENKAPGAEQIFDFHRFAGDGDNTNSIRMNRNNEMLTVSITGISIGMNTATMQHLNLVRNTESKQEFHLETAAI